VDRVGVSVRRMSCSLRPTPAPMRRVSVPGVQVSVSSRAGRVAASDLVCGGRGPPRRASPSLYTRWSEDAVAEYTECMDTVERTKMGSSDFRVGTRGQDQGAHLLPSQGHKGRALHSQRQPLGLAPPTTGFRITTDDRIDSVCGEPSCATGRNALMMRGRSSAPE
jgi:hypothetical protein